MTETSTGYRRDMSQEEWDDAMSFLLGERWEDQSFRQARGIDREIGPDFDITRTYSTLRGRKQHTEVPYYLR